MTWQVFDEKANRFAKPSCSRAASARTTRSQSCSQLHRVAPHLLWRFPQERRHGGAAQLPLPADDPLMSRSPTPTSRSLAPSSPAASKRRSLSRRAACSSRGRRLSHPGPSPTRELVACAPRQTPHLSRSPRTKTRRSTCSLGTRLPPRPSCTTTRVSPVQPSWSRSTTGQTHDDVFSLHPAALPHRRHHALMGSLPGGAAYSCAA